jgi:hypothetical protein
MSIQTIIKLDVYDNLKLPGNPVGSSLSCLIKDKDCDFE